MPEKELKNYYEIYCQAWKFFKDHADVQEADEWWKKLTHDAWDIVDKLQSDFAVSLFAVVLAELERIGGAKYDGIKQAG